MTKEDQIKQAEAKQAEAVEAGSGYIKASQSHYFMAAIRAGAELLKKTLIKSEGLHITEYLIRKAQSGGIIKK